MEFNARKNNNSNCPSFIKLLPMDRIIVFDTGRIVENGSHDELLDHNGIYKTLWNSQISGFLPDKVLYSCCVARKAFSVSSHGLLTRSRKQ